MPEEDLSLRALIRASGKTQTQVADEIEVDRTYVSQMVNGKVNWVNSAYFPALVTALGLNLRQISKLKGDAVTDLVAAAVQAGAVSGLRAAAGPEDMRGLTPYRPRNEVRHLGQVAAGRRGSVLYDEGETRMVPDDIVNGYDPEDLFTLDVTGDSMTCSDVRFEVREGATVVLHSGLSPQPGDVVSVWLTDEEVGVLKMYRPQEDHTVLESLNRKHAPIIINDQTPAVIQGVLVGIWMPRHGRRR